MRLTSVSAIVAAGALAIATTMMPYSADAQAVGHKKWCSRGSGGGFYYCEFASKSKCDCISNGARCVPIWDVPRVGPHGRVSAFRHRYAYRHDMH